MKKDKKSKKAKKNERVTVAVAAVKHSHAETKSTAKSEAKVDALVREIIERVADKWTMVVLDVLAEQRQQRRGEANRAEQVGGDDGFRIGEIVLLSEEVFCTHDAGVVEIGRAHV